ncbi:MAG: type IV secretion system protein [Promicromonosporaceae bacterium]|nr:type IV secretion system protein [Promicromonosporaceae bacterium]
MDVCDLPVAAPVCKVATDGAASVLTGPAEWLAGGVAGMATYLLRGVWSVFEATTFVDIASPRFQRVYAILFGVAVFVMVAFFLLQLIGGMVRRDPTALSRAGLGLGKAVLGSFVALSLIATALEIVDRLCLAIVAAAGTTVAAMGDRIDLLTGTVGTAVATGPAVAFLIALFLGGLAVAAAFIVWISLLVRKALLLVAIVFAPIAFSGATWDATRGWVSRWTQFVVALIVSKLVMVVVFLLAAEQVSAPIDTDLRSVADPLAGIVLLLIAGFAPYLTYKAISFMGVDFYHAMSTEQEAKQALNRPVPVPPSPMRMTPPRVLSGADGSDKPPPSMVARGAGSAGGTFGPGGGSGAQAAAGTTSGATAGSSAAAAGAAGAATGGAAVAALALKSAATAGPRLGASVADRASRQTDLGPGRSDRR